MVILQEVTRALIRLLKAQVYPDVDVQAHPDFGEIASLPKVILTLPALYEVMNEQQNQDQRTLDLEAGTITIASPAKVYDLQFGVTLAATSPISGVGIVGLLELQQKYMLLFGSTKQLALESGQRYKLDHEPSLSGANGVVAGPVLSSRSTLWVRGVDISPSEVRVAKLVKRRDFRFHRLEDWPFEEV